MVQANVNHSQGGTPMSPNATVADRLELIEARAWSELYTAAPAATARELGVGSVVLGTATAVMAARVDVLAYNRVVGLGLDGPVEDDDVTAIVDAYRAASVPRFFVQLAPHAGGNPAERLAAHGFRPYNHWVKLSRAVAPPAEVDTDLRVEAIGADRAGEFGAVFTEAFEWPQATAPWVAALVGRPGWYHYLATDGGRGVATAAMFVDGDCAWIDFASTLPAYRGRGAQSALLARRLAECEAAGVRTVVVEAGEGSTSMRNLVRAGFVIEYRRTNYILELIR
jgi:GNAT superfamily N-acetyltransferase